PRPYPPPTSQARFPIFLWYPSYRKRSKKRPPDDGLLKIIWNHVRQKFPQAAPNRLRPLKISAPRRIQRLPRMNQRDRPPVLASQALDISFRENTGEPRVMQRPFACAQLFADVIHLFPPRIRPHRPAILP